MVQPYIGSCPSCHAHLQVRRLTCSQCGIGIDGVFEPPRLFQLSREQLHFVEVFLTSRGNIREVERVLGISYPTVRSRLDGILEALGHPTGHDEGQADRRKEILAQLESGELSAKEAIKLLKE